MEVDTRKIFCWTGKTGNLKIQFECVPCLMFLKRTRKSKKKNGGKKEICEFRAPNTILMGELSSGLIYILKFPSHRFYVSQIRVIQAGLDKSGVRTPGTTTKSIVLSALRG